MNHQNEPAQLRFLEETAIRLRQSGFTVEPIEDHHLPVSVEKGRLCRISGKGSVLFRQERVDDLGAQDALQTVIDTAKMTSEYMAILEIVSVMDALSVEVPLPSHKLDAPLGGVARQYCAAEVREDAVVAVQSAGFEPRRGFQNCHVFRSHFGGVDHRLQSVLRPNIVHVLLPVQHAALAGNAAEAPFFPADGQAVILDRLHRETVLPQPGGGFFKVTELRGFVLIVHCEVLLVSKKISRSILKCSGRVMD